MNHMLNVSDIADGLHPTLAGYNKMGDAWFSAIQAIVPEPSTFTLLAVGGISVLACFRTRGPLPKCKS